MNILAGTSGWQYKEWKGSFYPEDMATGDMLTFYAENFPTVEINNTFYRMPKESVLQSWAESVPEGFTFVLKASRRITHFARLKEEARDPLEYMLRTAATLGSRMGPILFQLPPNLKVDAARLASFVRHLPEGTRAAFEFRHPSWLEDEEVLTILRDRDLALCIANTEEDQTPFHATASYGYMRLRKAAYEEGELEEWSRKISEQKWTDAYVFFKHEDEGTGPKLARRFMALFD